MRFPVLIYLECSLRLSVTTTTTSLIPHTKFFNCRVEHGVMELGNISSIPPRGVSSCSVECQARPHRFLFSFPVVVHE